MKPDQERIHTVLTDTISLMCRNGLNYEKELKVQGVIGVTIDGSEVFIVHINETFDISNNDTDVEFSNVGEDDCKTTSLPLPSRLTCWNNQKNMLTDYSHATPITQRSNRLGKMKSRHKHRMHGFTPSSGLRSLLCNDRKSPTVSGNPELRFAFSGKTDNAHNIERIEVGDFPEHDAHAALDGEGSESNPAKENDLIKSDDVNSEPFVAKEDGEEGSFRNYNSIASSLQDSSDTAADSDQEIEQNGAMIGNGRIKVESEVNSADADIVRNEFSVSSNVTSLFPESQEFKCFNSDHKSDVAEYQLLSEGHEPGTPFHSRHLVHPLSPSQTPRRVFPSLSRDVATSRKVTSFPQGFGSAAPAPSETQHDLWRLMARFICDVPGCNTSFSNKQNLLRHQTHKHGRQKIPRQSRAAAHFFAANISAGCAANVSLPNFMNSSEG